VLIRADARALPLSDGCIDAVVTSPPYYGLRDYGHAGQIGLERSPDAYVASIVSVFVEARRVLKDDGVAWLNLGDSYAGSGPSGASYQSETTKRRAEMTHDGAFAISKTLGVRGLSYAEKKPIPPAGLKSKDLIGIPWRVAFALQADGWYLRSDIIWSKPNPMPESVTDRPTKAHEYLFLLTKSERYYYDAQAIAEPVSAAMLQEMEQGYDGLGLKEYEAAGVQNPSSVKARIIENYRKRNGALARGGETDSGRGPGRGDGGAPCNNRAQLTRNRRSVWTIPTMPYAGAHFATMPEKLVEPCILAGCPMGGLVLDPFSGSGTVLAVAERLGRRGVGVDLNPAYHELAKVRTAQRGLRFGVDEAVV